MKIKVCGMREADNIMQLNLLAIDYMGLIFHEPSPRFVQQAVPVCSGGIQRIGVFVNKSLPYITSKVQQYQLDGVQLHGQESTSLCGELKQMGLITIKVFSVLDELPISKLEEYERYCDFFLFDTKGKAAGGNGVQFAWQILESYHLDRPFFLSGGIGLKDAKSIRALDINQLYGVDINSGFENKPAIKNIKMISEFIKILQE